MGFSVWNKILGPGTQAGLFCFGGSFALVLLFNGGFSFSSLVPGTDFYPIAAFWVKLRQAPGSGLFYKIHQMR